MYRHYKSDFPNQAHQLLVSVSKHFFVGARNIIRFQKKMMDVSLKNFEKSEREHLVYYILRDHFSGFYYIGGNIDEKHNTAAGFFAARIFAQTRYRFLRHSGRINDSQTS